MFGHDDSLLSQSQYTKQHVYINVRAHSVRCKRLLHVHALRNVCMVGVCKQPSSRLHPQLKPHAQTCQVGRISASSVNDLFQLYLFAIVHYAASSSKIAVQYLGTIQSIQTFFFSFMQTDLILTRIYSNFKSIALSCSRNFCFKISTK